MGIWVPNRGAGCLTWFLNIVFLGVGGVILFTALSMPHGAGPGGIFGSRRTELIVTGAFFMVSPFIGMFMIRFVIDRFNRKARRLIVHGIRGTAEVVSMRETGTTVNNAPQVEFQMKVSVPGREPYTAVMKDYISLVDLAALQPGSTVDVRVDPDDPGSLIIWSGDD